ncbi:hypothetical protein [Thioalkalivibrio thiocyanodenitrificans]|uniref:hypothetical protein n=1 Tax=Thioalkalivibrio thiocyanodenitrificans TaxID=243063 RepID=UPI000381D660|nr:hypothetical protein [Thioalkalivibrio thiocyanodenitrificans]
MNLIDVLTKLEDWIELANEFIVSEDSDVRTWDDGILGVIRTDPTSGKRTLHIDRGILSEVLGPEHEEALIAAGLVPRKTDYRTKLGGKRRHTFDVYLDDLIETAEEVVIGDSKEHHLREQIKVLRKEIQLLRSSASNSEKLKEMIMDTLQQAKARPKARPLKVARKRGQNLAGWATLFLSDWHWDEFVDPKQIEGMNEYDHQIAVARARRTFTTAADLLLNHSSGAYHEGIVVALGGDMVSGMIHEELRRTNDAPITETVLTMSDELISGIKMLAQEFPEVYVPAVVGNHGRLDRKPTSKGRVQDNFDWLVYNLVARGLVDVPNVIMGISDATDVQFDLYDTTFRLTHGDQFRGGGGIGGKWPTLMRGDYRKRKRAGNVGDAYDYLIMGHWHAYGAVDGLIVNGSLKGYDEYAYTSNFDYEPPTQAMWVTHPEYGIVSHLPIYAEGRREGASSTSIRLGDKVKKAA